MKKYELYRTERDKGLTYQQIADKYGVSKQNVAQACQGKQKKHFRFWNTSSCVYPNVRKWLNENQIRCSDLLHRLGLECLCNNYRRIENYLSGKNDPPKRTVDKFLSITGLSYEQFFESEKGR